jgi:hypothetical protein
MTVPLSKLDRETTGLKLFPLFTLLGWVFLGVSIVVGILVLSATSAAYWGDNAKAVRDAAEAGSGLLGNLNTLQSIPKWLVPLAFLGVASFMTGIALEFAAIPGIIDRRTAGLKKAIPLMGGN